jgi:hypothetical protein
MVAESNSMRRRTRSADVAAVRILEVFSKGAKQPRYCVEVAGDVMPKMLAGFPTNGRSAEFGGLALTSTTSSNALA